MSKYDSMSGDGFFVGRAISMRGGRRCLAFLSGRPCLGLKFHKFGEV